MGDETNAAPTQGLGGRILVVDDNLVMRRMLGEQTDLKPIEPKFNILF